MAEEVLHKLLLEIIMEQNFVNYDLKIEPISSDGANYTTKLYNITVTEGDRVVYMFGKVAALSEKIWSQAPQVYETEKVAYTKLLKVYQQLEEEHKVPQEHRLIFAKFYGFNPEKYKETIVLENLVMNGYQSYDRFKSIDWEYAKSAVSNLTKMHALAFACGEYYPEEFNKIVEDLKFEWDIGNYQTAGYTKSMFTIAVNNTREENRDKLQKFFESFDPKTFVEFFKWSRKPVLGHGDYRPSNLMHRICEDGTVKIKIVDLQTLQRASPIVDLLYFIYTGSDEEFRAKYYEKLLDHYYTELNAAMTRLHLKPDDVYSRDDFNYELKKKLNFGLIISILLLPLVAVDVENAQVNEDSSFLSIANMSDLYTERLNGVVNDYVKFGVLK